PPEPPPPPAGRDLDRGARADEVAAPSALLRDNGGMDAPRSSLRLTTADGWRLNLACYSARRVAAAAAAAETMPCAPAAMVLSPGMMLDGRAMDRPPGRG